MQSQPLPRRGWVAALLLLVACSSTSPTPSPSGTLPRTTTPSASASMVTITPSASPTAGVTIYVVLGGDTLFSIARRFGANLAELQAWNADRYPSLATDPGTLEAGWELVVAQSPGVTPNPTAQPTPPTSPVPSVPPPVAELPCTAGNRAGGGIATYARIPNAGNEVALTFDMGGRLDPALDIMAFLVANKVCATIFAAGAMSSTPLGQQVLAVIRAHPGQFEIANHTMAHCDLVRGGGGSPTAAPCQTGGAPTADFIRKQLTDAEAILRAGTGQNPQPYWRPPYGSINAGVIAAAASVGYTKTFLWDIDTIDWKPESDGGPTAQQIAAKVITNAQGGSTVLFHIGGYNTLAAIHSIVPGLRERGMVLTSLSDLLDGQ